MVTPGTAVPISPAMIVVTGGAGFIGSNVHAALSERQAGTIIVDRLRSAGKWRNLRKHPPSRLVEPEAIAALLEEAPPIEAVIHLGAISETTASDGDLVWNSNVTLSQLLWQWCAERGVPLIYASSASTYGDGSHGFDDDDAIASLRRLRPLNLYGWSKHAFDLWAVGQADSGHPCPPFWAGLKFLNFYGPNK